MQIETSSSVADLKRLNVRIITGVTPNLPPSTPDRTTKPSADSDGQQRELNSRSNNATNYFRNSSSLEHESPGQIPTIFIIMGVYDKARMLAGRLGS